MKAAKPWTRKDLLALRSLSVSEVEAVLDESVPFKKLLQDPARSVSKNQPLAGRTVAFLFSEASTRTRSSFEVAARRLGAEVLGFSVASSSLLKGETLLDTIRNLEAMGVDYFIVRHEQSGVLEPLTEQTRASLLNAGDGSHEHPTQALLDLFTLRQKKGRIKGLKVVIVGDIAHSRVARSNLHGLRKLGAQVVLCGPQALLPEGLKAPGVRLTHDLDAALEDADAVNVLRIQLERQKQNLITSVHDYFQAYGLTPERLRLAKPDCLVLHPGPMNRGVEIASDVADGPQSAILEQVTNGVAVRMAVLSLLEAARSRRG